MMSMKFCHLGVLAIGAIGFAWPASADPLPMDQPTTVGGIETVCTGIGSAEDDPRWKAYPIRVEFSNADAQYIAGAHVNLSGGGKVLATFDCSGAWVLFKLGSGTYNISASLLDRPDAGERSATFSPLPSGQRRVVIQFPINPRK